MYKLVNLTPHEVNILDSNKKVILTIPPSKKPVRLKEVRIPIGSINGITLYKKSFFGTILPLPKKDTYYIVSLPIAQAFPDRHDLIVPDKLVRNSKGQVIGATSFSIL